MPRYNRNSVMRVVLSALLRAASLAVVGMMFAVPAFAGVKPFPATFHAQQMPVSDGTLYVRVGGHGPTVLLLHGFGDSGDMWEPVVEVLVKNHTVVVPDLRGMGL